MSSDKRKKVENNREILYVAGNLVKLRYFLRLQRLRTESLTTKY